MIRSIQIAALALTVSLVGCATSQPPPPVDVRLIPNDCANRTLIVNYLQQLADRPRLTFESERDYETHRSQVRQRIWALRYHCQPV